MTTPVYKERVLPSAATFMLPVVLGALIFAVLLPINDTLGTWLAVGAISSLTIVFIFKAPVIEITTTELRVGRARILRELLGKIEVIAAEDAFAARGHLLDARAFTCFQASVRTMLKIEIADEADPTTYWLFSSRNPQEIKELLG